MNFAQISTVREQAFVVDIEQLGALITILSDFASPVVIEVFRADDLTIALENISALRAQENPFERRILSITLSAGPADPDEKDRWASVELECFPRRSLDDPRASIQIYGPERDAMATKQGLLEVINGTRPWYSRISNNDSPLIFSAPLLLLMFLLMTYTDQVKSFVPADPLPNAATITLGLIVSVAGMWSAARGLQTLWSWLFPNRVFLIGQEVKRHKRRLYWHRALAGLLVSVGIALLI